MREFIKNLLSRLFCDKREEIIKKIIANNEVLIANNEELIEIEKRYKRMLSSIYNTHELALSNLKLEHDLRIVEREIALKQR